MFTIDCHQSDEIANFFLVEVYLKNSRNYANDKTKTIQKSMGIRYMFSSQEYTIGSKQFWNITFLLMLDSVNSIN